MMIELQVLCDLVIRPRHERTRLHLLSVYNMVTPTWPIVAT